MKKIAVAIFFMLFVFCSEQPTYPPENGNVDPAAMLTVSDTGLTRLGLRLQLQNAHLPTLAALTRANVKDTLHDTLLFSHTLTGSDTAFYDDNLQPNENYRYELWLAKDSTQQQWYRFAFNRGTMDTTGHNFSWQVYEFGGAGGSSYLNDVAIVDENNIWAVGRISVADSAGEVETYNAVHWDGEKWELVKIEVATSFGTKIIGELRAIYANGGEDIWGFSVQGSYVHFDGLRWTTSFVEQRQGTINRIWASDENNVYFVGTNGNITHYDGQSWTKLESGTELDIQDIWGANNPLSGETKILAVASNRTRNEGRELLQIKDDHVNKLNTTGLSWSLRSVWFYPHKRYVICGDGIYMRPDLVGDWQRDETFPSLYKDAVRGVHINNIAVAGSFGLLSHFNGNTWRHYTRGDIIDAEYNAVDISEETIVAVGNYGSLAIITLGSR